jgi:hypothetical protein
LPRSSSLLPQDDRRTAKLNAPSHFKTDLMVAPPE